MLMFFGWGTAVRRSSWFVITCDGDGDNDAAAPAAADDDDAAADDDDAAADDDDDDVDHDNDDIWTITNMSYVSRHWTTNLEETL